MRTVPWQQLSCKMDIYLKYDTDVVFAGFHRHFLVAEKIFYEKKFTSLLWFGSVHDVSAFLEIVVYTHT